MNTPTNNGMLTVLAPLSSITLDGTERFDPTSVFTAERDVQPDGISFWMNSDFKENFLPKKESDIASSTLNIFRQKVEARAGRVMSELGGEGRVEVSLYHFYQVIAHLNRGGDLKGEVRNYAGLMFVRGKDSILWQLRFVKTGDTFAISAHLIRYGALWIGGYTIFSPELAR